MILVCVECMRYVSLNAVATNNTWGGQRPKKGERKSIFRSGENSKNDSKFWEGQNYWGVNNFGVKFLEGAETEQSACAMGKQGPPSAQAYMS